jgi:hypothetical protein
MTLQVVCVTIKGHKSCLLRDLKGRECSFFVGHEHGLQTIIE